MIDLASIVPRWEWRTFAGTLDEPAARLAPFLAAPQQTEEIYLLSERRDVTVKIREDRIDVKVLQDVEPHGLELWNPILQSHFPISWCLVGAVFACWQLLPPRLAQSMYTRDAFLELIAGTRGVTVVRLTKRRRTGTFADCVAEFADLTIGDSTLQTIAVEHVDPGRLVSAVHALGLAGRQNVNYVHGLTRAAAHDHPAAAPGLALV